MRYTGNDILARCRIDHPESMLLDACIGRLARRHGNSFEIDKDQIRHITDWLRAALANDEPWLKNVDDHGRPKKLLKFGSVDAIVREADKAMLKAAQRLKGVKLIEGDEKLVEMLDDGYYVVQLLTPAALDRESAQMQHCIGNGGYDDYLNDGRHLYLSLRDAHGKAHATIEIEDGAIIQFQGKQNDIPVRKYCDLLIPFLSSQKWKSSLPAWLLGYVIDDQENWHPLHDLPEGLIVLGNLELMGNCVDILPNGLKVEGNLTLTDNRLITLPEGLHVGGNLTILNTSISSFPPDLKVGLSLSAPGNLISSLPDGIQVGGDFDLRRNPIETLPDNFHVKGNLHLRWSSIERLPKGLVVDGNLNIAGTPLSTLPDDLQVGGCLCLSGSSVEYLPEGIRVLGSIDLRATSIDRIPDSIPDQTEILKTRFPVTASFFRSCWADGMLPPRSPEQS